MGTIPIYWLAIVASFIQIIGYADYLIQSKAHQTRPNPATWGMWAFGAATHLWAYSQVTEGWEQDLLPAVCSIVCLVVFVSLWLRGNFSRGQDERLSTWEKNAFIADVSVTVLFGSKIVSASIAALALQLDDLLTYFPTIKDTARNPKSENRRPWIFWAIGYALQGAIVASVGGGWVEWSYPLINLPLCLAVVFLASRTAATNPG